MSKIAIKISIDPNLKKDVIDTLTELDPKESFSGLVSKLLKEWMVKAERDLRDKKNKQFNSLVKDKEFLDFLKTKNIKLEKTDKE